MAAGRGVGALAAHAQLLGGLVEAVGLRPQVGGSRLALGRRGEDVLRLGPVRVRLLAVPVDLAGDPLARALTLEPAPLGGPEGDEREGRDGDDDEDDQKGGHGTGVPPNPLLASLQ